MERTLSEEERIRRAEEIYYRRKNLTNTPMTATVNVNPKKNYKLLKKVIFQVLVCMGLYAVIYNLQGKNDDFSIDSINYLKDTMAYDINIDKYWNDIKNYMNVLQEGNNETNGINENEVIEETLSISEEENIQNNESSDVVTEESKEEASSISQIEDDAEYIKNNFSLIKPVTGVVTSRFGLRNPTTETVPKYHTGIDIGVPEGTVFIAAMEGTVELVSSEGDYRKPYKNNKWRCDDTLCTL